MQAARGQGGTFPLGMALSYAKPTLATLFSYISVTNTRRDKRIVAPRLRPSLFLCSSRAWHWGKRLAKWQQQLLKCGWCVRGSVCVCVYESLVACTIKSVTQVVIIQNIYAWMVALCPSLNPGTGRKLTRRHAIHTDTNTHIHSHSHTHTHTLHCHWALLTCLSAALEINNLFVLSFSIVNNERDFQ